MEKELKAYGLSDKEVKIYLANLKAGSCTANRLSEITGIRRSTVYEVIESLKKKGLVKSFRKEKKYYFEAIKPKILIDLLREKQKLIKIILPDLNKLSKTLIKKPAVSLYEGKVGIRIAISEILDSKEILVCGASKEGERVFDTFPANFAQKRATKKIKMRAIIEKNPPEHMVEKKVRKYTQIRNLKSLRNHKVVYFIYNHTLLAVTLGQELIAIKIQSPLLVESQKILFEEMWKIAKS